ncbi:flippase [Methanohalophilus sp.]|uniref:flippase n=1 Tax=Methanohalophilus sp. TaxID=1966352 RepID=UPI0026164EDF|nr:flippase [Methanohalophilus sp.]MDK2892482.1 hypothetical protein [Methanohalophilus sp.]
MFLDKIFSRIMSVGEVKRQSIATFVSQIAFTFIGFLSTMYFAHTVGSSVLGAYFLFIAYFGIINLVTDGGLGGAAIKRISEGEEQDEYFTAYFLLRFALTVLIILGMIVMRPDFVDFDRSGVFEWLLLALVISFLNGSISSGIAGRGKMGIQAAGNFITNVSRIIIQVLAIFLGFGVAGLVGGFIAGLLIGALLKLRFFDLKLVDFEWRHIKSLSSFSFWLFLTSAGVVLYSHADSIMIGYFLSNSEVGIYQVVFQFTSLATIATVAIRTTLWPKVSRWGKSGDMRSVETSLSKAFTFSLVLAVPLFAGGAVIGDRLLYFFYGAGFATGYYVLIILFFTQIINVFQYFLTMYLGALDRQKESFQATGSATVANLILNFILIPLMGIEGAAIATLITMGMNAFLAWRFLSRRIRVRLERNSLISISKATILMLVFVGVYRFLVPLSSIWLTLIPVAIGAMIYIIVILRTDRTIYDEFRDVALKMGITWPPLL